MKKTHSRHYKKRFHIIFCAFLYPISCGPSTSIFKLATPKNHQNAFDINLSLAKSYYDTENYEQAKNFGEKAYHLDPHSEEAAVAIGYIYLALAGITPFSLAQKMQAEGEVTKQTQASHEGETSEKPSQNTGDTLATLGNVLGLTQEDYDLMGTLDTTVPSIPVIEPVCADTARTLVKKLTYVNYAIKTICPFVDFDAKIPEDARHTCTPSNRYLRQQVHAHFLWALAHLTEALGFHTIVTYATTNSGKTNLEMRVDRIKDYTINNPSHIKDLLDEIQQLNKTITKVLPVVNLCSPESPQTQLSALVNDMLAVSFAFNQLPGIPDEMTTSITSAMKKIQTIRENSAKSKDSLAQTQALKGDLTKKMSEVIRTKINSTNTSKYSADQITKVCSAYANISGGNEHEKPDICL